MPFVRRYAFAYDGFLRLASAPYTATTQKEWKTQVTNAEFGSSLKSISYDDHYWSFEQLQEFLTKTGKSSDDFVDNVMRHKIHKAMIFSLLATTGRMAGSLQTNQTNTHNNEPGGSSGGGVGGWGWHNGVGSGTYQLFAFDFMLDGKTLDVKLLEANGRPAL